MDVISQYLVSPEPYYRSVADPYVSRIFGAKNYLVVDHLQRLPTILPMLYMGLTR